MTLSTEMFHTTVGTQAVGMDSWVHLALKSILRGDPIFESSAWFFVIIYDLLSKIHENKFLDTKKISFSKADFYKATAC